MVKRSCLLMILMAAVCGLLTAEGDVSILLSGNRMVIMAEGRCMLSSDILEEDASLIALAKARQASGENAVDYILKHNTLNPTFNQPEEGVALISDLVTVREETPGKVFANGHQQVSNKYMMIMNIKVLQDRVTLIRREPWMARTFQIENDRNEALFSQLIRFESQANPPGLSELMPVVKKLKASEWVREGMQTDNAAAQVQHFDQAVILDPDYAFARFQRGKAYVKMKAYEKALEDFNTVISEYPDWVEVYYSRSLVAGNLGNYDQVIDDCTLILNQDPAFLQALVNRGIAYSQKGQLTEALADYQKALAIDPTHVVAHYNTACIYALQGNSAAALQSIEAVLENGFTQFQTLLEDKDLASLQGSPELTALIDQYRDRGL